MSLATRRQEVLVLLDDLFAVEVVAELPGVALGPQVGHVLLGTPPPDNAAANRIAFNHDDSAPRITVDVGGYRAAARDALIKKAKEAADKVRKWGDIVELEPMNAYDRRVVHQALRDDPDIETQSVEVEGTDKKAMLLRPKRKE